MSLSEVPHQRPAHEVKVLLRRLAEVAEGCPTGYNKVLISSISRRDIAGEQPCHPDGRIRFCRCGDERDEAVCLEDSEKEIKVFPRRRREGPESLNVTIIIRGQRDVKYGKTQILRRILPAAQS